MVTLNVLMKLYILVINMTQLMSFLLTLPKLRKKSHYGKIHGETYVNYRRNMIFNTAIILQPLLGTGNKSLSLEEQN